MVVGVSTQRYWQPPLSLKQGFVVVVVVAGVVVVVVDVVDVDVLTIGLFRSPNRDGGGSSSEAAAS